MKKLFILTFSVFLLSHCTKPHIQSSDILVTGTAEPVINLDGAWKFTTDPPENFFMNEVSCAGWKDILVPVERGIQGFVAKYDTQYVYKTLIAIPSDYKGKTIKLRFEDVNSISRVWVNGTFVGANSDVSAKWDCDITKIVEPGKEAWLTVELTGRNNIISVPGGYDKDKVGSLGSVSLLALPENYPKAIIIQTRFDSKNKDADLNIRIVSSTKEKTWVGFRLYDPVGKLIRLNDKRYLIKEDSMEISFPVKTPLKWDPEHPKMYTLITEVFNKSILTASGRTKISFQVKEKKDNQ